MQAQNSYGRETGRHGQSLLYSKDLLQTVARAPRGSVETSQLQEMMAAAELAGVDVREARAMLEGDPGVGGAYRKECV